MILRSISTVGEAATGTAPQSARTSGSLFADREVVVGSTPQDAGGMAFRWTETPSQKLVRALHI